MISSEQEARFKIASVQSRLHLPFVGLACLVVAVSISDSALADEISPSQRKSTDMQALAKTPDERQPELFLRPTIQREHGHRILVGNGDAQVPLIVVRGTPYEMGRQLGKLIADQMRLFIPPAIEGLKAELNVTQEDLGDVWSRTAAYTDDRVEQEMAGLADGSQVPLAQLQAMHAIPLHDILSYPALRFAVAERRASYFFDAGTNETLSLRFWRWQARTPRSKNPGSRP
ncbi:C45 family peptidase [Novipirellula artificiosorum]|uniref:hypothetical protein n=1 Tax=Novipirellula artificiosorum TaxID=2528016 RepID=UPI001E480CAF|nr:hypothetical protein [Novipirellula artificiosorum]